MDEGGETRALHFVGPACRQRGERGVIFFARRLALGALLQSSAICIPSIALLPGMTGAASISTASQPSALARGVRLASRSAGTPIAKLD